MGKEPGRLRHGKLFHLEVRRQWASLPGVKFEHTRREPNGRFRRIDVLVNVGDEMVSVIEIKNTDWDRMRPDRVRRNALRHASQVWDYVEPYLDQERLEVCPGVIYRKVPRSRDRLKAVEAVLNGRGIQVVWQGEASRRHIRRRES